MVASQQSPVDIPAGAVVYADDIEWAYRPAPLVISDNPLAVQVEFGPGSSATIDGSRHALTQFHFHSPGEHRFAGRTWPMELHLVHESADGGLMVVGIPVVEGAPNSALDPILARMAGDPAPAGIDATDLLPADRRHVRYQGSLTAPPYTPGVAWCVLLAATEISSQQLSDLRAVHHGNDRPIQPLDGRVFI